MTRTLESNVPPTKANLMIDTVSTAPARPNHSRGVVNALGLIALALGLSAMVSPAQGQSAQFRAQQVRARIMANARGLFGASPQTRMNVSGLGEVQAQPHALTMLSQVSGSAELASDAMVKYRDAKRRAIKALNNLDIDNLSVKGLGMSLSFAYDRNTLNKIRQGKVQPGQTNAKPKIVANEGLRIHVTGLDELSAKERTKLLVKLIDATQDAGLALGGLNAQSIRQYGYNTNMSAFAFETKRSEKLITQARKKAIKQARARAKRLADQAGLTLGPLLSINQNISTNPNPYNNNNRMQMFRVQLGQADQNRPGGSIMTDKLGPVPLRVGVNLQFAISPSHPSHSGHSGQAGQGEQANDAGQSSQPDQPNPNKAAQTPAANQTTPGKN